ncbi:MAG: shikimate dehydrogenase [Rhodobacteraceae bacterium]|nr:shikimate dehydrogenase [Paracoccaceae bacterium]
MTVSAVLAGIIGDPIRHSKSPILHSHWLHRYGVKGYYVPLRITAADLPMSLRLLPNMGFRGINVTIPHKRAVLDFAHEVTPQAYRIGAANTLTFNGNGHIHADNTDGSGFLANVQQSAPNWDITAGPVLILGAGGAARAILVAIIEAGAPRIILSNRTSKRAEVMAKDMGGPIEIIDWNNAYTALPRVTTLINATSLGMVGRPPLNLDLTGLSPKALVTDIVYTPLETPLLRAATAMGCSTINGLGMLLHQAAPGFERWFGTTPVVDQDLRSAVLAG